MQKSSSRNYGKYTTTSNSSSSNTSSTNTTKSNSQSIGNSINLMGRELLTIDEVLRIERPDTLVLTAGIKPCIMCANDLSRWTFNKLFGMGDIEHNQKLREERHNSREKTEFREIQFWDCLNYIKLLKHQKRNKNTDNSNTTEDLINKIEI